MTSEEAARSSKKISEKPTDLIIVISYNLEMDISDEAAAAP